MYQGIDTPLVSIILTEVIETFAGPVTAAKEIVAIWPLPEIALVLITAILIVPGVAVLGAINAPEINPPWVTVGEDIVVLS